jgi:class 3 adenylate cyclase
MFCDLVGSTSLAAKLDAEDWRTLVNTYLDEASVAVTGLGGHVLKKLGDGLMALFGYLMRRRTTPSAPCGSYPPRSWGELKSRRPCFAADGGLADG